MAAPSLTPGFFRKRAGRMRATFQVVPEKTIVENMRHMRKSVVDNTFLAMQELEVLFLEKTREIAEGPRHYGGWESHPERHDSYRWPNDTALEQLSSSTEQTGDRINVAVFHPPETYSVQNGKRFAYGGYLESGRGEGSGPGGGAIARAADELREEFRRLIKGAKVDPAKLKKSKRIPA